MHTCKNQPGVPSQRPKACQDRTRTLVIHSDYNGDLKALEGIGKLKVRPGYWESYRISFDVASEVSRPGG